MKKILLKAGYSLASAAKALWDDQVLLSLLVGIAMIGTAIHYNGVYHFTDPMYLWILMIAFCFGWAALYGAFLLLKCLVRFAAWCWRMKTDPEEVRAFRANVRECKAGMDACILTPLTDIVEGVCLLIIDGLEALLKAIGRDRELMERIREEQMLRAFIARLSRKEAEGTVQP